MKRNLLLGGILCSLMGLLGCLESETDDLNNLLVTIENDIGLSRFAEAINLSSFPDVFERGVVTVFAPTNQAFDSYLTQEGYNTVADIPSDVLDHLIGYHVISGVGESNDIVSGYYETLSTDSPNGGSLSILIEVTSGTLTINAQTQVVRFDIQGTNGVIHLIDRVLGQPTIEQTFNNNSTFTIFKGGLERFGLFDSLETNRRYTFITPPNDAITQYLQARGLAGISDIEEEEYRKLILRHVIQGNLNLEALQGNTFDTLADSLTAEVEVSTSPTTQQIFYTINDSSLVLRGNIQARDGVIHVVNSVLSDL